MKTGKQHIAMLLALLLLLSPLGIGSLVADATGGYVYTLLANGNQTTFAQPGDEVTVTLLLTNQDVEADKTYDLYGLTDTVRFDKAFFEYVIASVTTEEIDGLTSQIDNTTGTEKTNGWRVNRPAGKAVNVAAEVTLMTLKLKVKAGATGESWIRNEDYGVWKNGYFSASAADACVKIGVPVYKITVEQPTHGYIFPGQDVKLEKGASQTFAITPADGWQVKMVYVDGEPIGAVSSVSFENPDRDHTISATFEKPDTSTPMYTIHVVKPENGRISPSGDPEYAKGDNVTFTFRPDEGYQVENVIVDGFSMGPLDSYTLTKLSGGHTVEAEFAPKGGESGTGPFKITVADTENGSIEPDGGENGCVTVAKNGSQTFTIKPNAGYQIESVFVDGRSVGSDDTYTFDKPDKDHTIYATFKPTGTTGSTFTVTAAAGDHGKISPSGAVKVNAGENATFTITPDAGYVIKDVKVDDESVGAVPSYTFTGLNRNRTISASFEPAGGTVEQFTITASAGEHGKIAPSGSVAVNEGGSRKFDFTPDSGYEIDDVTVDGISIGKPAYYTFTKVGDNHTISASFMPTVPASQTVTITVTEPEHGTISPGGSVPVDKDGSKPFTITPDSGCKLKDVLVDGQPIADDDPNFNAEPTPTYTFKNPTGDHTLSATFEPDTEGGDTPTEQFTITVTAPPHGSISPGTQKVDKNGSKSFTITPDSGYQILEVLVDGQSVGTVKTYTFTNVTADHTLTATFYVIPSGGGGGGNVPGYIPGYIPGYVPNGGGGSSYGITVDDCENGSLDPDRDSAKPGSTVKLNVKPDDGYQLDTITVLDPDGNPVPVTRTVGDNAYTFEMPSGKVRVSATFRPVNDQTPTQLCPRDETCPIEPFPDTLNDYWWHDGIHYCVENGLMIGFPDGEFKPNDPLSRAQIVTILWRIDGSPDLRYAMSFADVPEDEWYSEAIRWAQSTGVVLGYDDTAFGPNDNVTREQLAAILMRFADYQEMDVSQRSDLAQFIDVSRISTWAWDNVRWANANDIITGRTTTTLVPDGDTTRAEAAEMIQRFCEESRYALPFQSIGKVL